MTAWLTAQALRGMAGDQSTDDSLCMMLFHTKVFALYTEHVCESIAKSSRANTASVETNSRCLKSSCPSQEANFSEGSWGANTHLQSSLKREASMGWVSCPLQMLEGQARWEERLGISLQQQPICSWYGQEQAQVPAQMSPVQQQEPIIR